MPEATYVSTPANAHAREIIAQAQLPKRLDLLDRERLLTLLLDTVLKNGKVEETK